MLTPARLFLLLVELMFVLLGALLLWVAVSGRVFFNPRATAWIALGGFMVFWGVRTWFSAGRYTTRAEDRVRGASLALVGLMMLGAAATRFAWVAPLLGAAGAVLILRGLASAVILTRAR